MLNLIRKYPLFFFLILTLLISWLPWYTGGYGILVFGPSIAGVITVALVKGKDGLKDLIQRTLKWRVGLKWWLIALFLPALLTLAALGINLLFGASLPPFTFIKTEAYLLPVFFLITIVGGPLGEEFGWRGFALPRLQEKTSPLLSSVLLGLIWGLWHLPQFFNPNAVHYKLGLTRLPLYGYDSALAVQPETVNLRLRIFISVPSVIGCGLAILALAFYPLYGDRLKEIKQKLFERKALQTKA